MSGPVYSLASGYSPVDGRLTPDLNREVTLKLVLPLIG